MLRNPVADTQKRISVVAVLAALVDFKFHAEIALAVAIKYRGGFVIVLVNITVLTFLIAPIAIGVIVVIIVVSVVPMNDSTAALAGRVVIVVARVAEWHTVRARIIVRPDSVTTVFAGDGFAVIAVVAEYVAVERVVVIVFDCCSAAATNGAGIFVVVHGVFLLINILLPKA